MKQPIPYIQKINAKIKGVNFAPADKYYRRLVTTKMPIAYTVPGNGSTKGTALLWIQERNYEIKGFVDPVTSGKFDDPTQKAMELHELFLTTWLGLQNEEENYIFDDGTKTGYRIQLNGERPITDNGVRHNIEWLPGTLYVGFQLNVPIIIHGGTELF